MKKSGKPVLKKENGITLIALVITIIVLLILAGISIATLTGENGILTRANDAKVETRGAAVEERKNLWKSEQDLDKRLGTSDAKELNELLDELENENLLIGNERQTIEETGKVTIGSRTIEFREDNIQTNNLNAHIFAVAEFDTVDYVRIYVKLDAEKYFELLTEEQKNEICEPLIYILKNYYQIEVNGWEECIEKYYEITSEHNITQKRALLEIISSSITIKFPKEEELLINTIVEGWKGTEEDIVRIGRDEENMREYWIGTNCDIKMYDKFGIINDTINIKYLVDVYSAESMGHPEIEMIEGEDEVKGSVIEPTYIYLDNGEKVCYTDCFIDYFDGQYKAYNYKENPLNLEYDKMYVVETQVNGYTTKGYIIIKEELKDFPNMGT